MARGDLAIEAKQLGRTFGRKHAIDAVDLAVAHGGIIGLVGPDGSGKTTLLQLLTALLDPTAGRCTVLGFDTVRDSAAITARVGYMPQGFTLYERLTVAENLAFAAKIRDVAPADFARRRDRLLAMAGLQPFVHRREAQLSGGMRKKLALCTNLIHEPPLLLLDEPGLGVDPLSRRELWRMLEEFRCRGTTIVFSTSYMDEAERCDRVAFLDAGRVIAQASPADLRAKGQGLVYRVVSRDPAEVEGLLRGRDEILGIQWQADAIRFILRPAAQLSSQLRRDLEQFGSVEPTAASMQDVYVILHGRAVAGQADAPSRKSLRPSASRPSIPAIETRLLTRRFGSFVAVDDISLTLKPGEIFGLLGANGAGKTTLIRVLCGLLAPSSGSAYVAGIDVAAAPRLLRQHIGYMSQRFSLYPDLTVNENLTFFASAYGMGGAKAKSAVAWASGAVGLDTTHDELVAELSGAMRQRLGLACSILHRPAVLFLDEPTSGVDPLSRFRFWALVNALAAAGTAVLITTHYLEEAVYCRRLGLMHEGRLIAVGDLSSLRAALPTAVPARVEDVFVAYIERERQRSSSRDVG